MGNSMEKVANGAKLIKVNLYIFKKETSTGHKFNDYSTKTLDGKFVKVRFTKECKMPEKPCVMFVPNDKINKTTNKKTGYPEFWVSAIDHVDEIEHAPQDLSNYFEEV